MGAGTWIGAAGLPLVAAASALHPRWRADWRERFGLAQPPVLPGSTWIAASSVGEVKAACALAAALPGPVLVTADTDTGAAAARARVPAAGRKPVDHPWTLAPLWADALPARLVWVEGAWWPALDRLARRAGVPVVRVNARPSPSAAIRLAAGLREDLVVARDPAAVAWFREREQPAEVGGELKADGGIPGGPLLHWERAFGVAGSTRPGDEAAVLAADPDLAWLIAPRHLDRLGEVESLLQGRRWVRRSALVGGRVPADTDVVLLDTMGELDRCYPGASVAFAGGTWSPRIGGHSPIEAWRAGVPVVCGPEIASHRELFVGCGAIQTDLAGLGDALRRAIGRAVPPAPAGAAARTAALVQGVEGGSSGGAPRPWARPAAALHRVGRTGWHGAWDLGLRTPVRVGVPVVSIGSANARGPGKTATARWFCEQLALRGCRPGVAIRGYGRTEGGPVRSWEDSTAGALGDEGAALAREGWPVVACADRVAAARALVAHGVDRVVLDDGLQHRRLHRDLDLAVVDGRFPGARGEIPMGEARECAIPARVHGVILHHGATLESPVPVARATRIPGPWMRGEHPRALPDGPLVAFAGTARPADFLAGLPQVARFRALPDHCRIDELLARELDRWAHGLPLVCTDKDHVRLPAWLAERTWWRTVRLELSGVPEAWFERLGPA